jgi:hypothetical protein
MLKQKKKKQIVFDLFYEKQIMRRVTLKKATGG